MTDEPGQAHFRWAPVGRLVLLLLSVTGCGSETPIPVSPELVSPEVRRLIDRNGLGSGDSHAEDPCVAEPMDRDAQRLLNRAKEPLDPDSLDSLQRDLLEVALARQTAGRWCSHATLLGVLGDLWSKREPSTAVGFYERALASAYRTTSPRLVAGLLNDLAVLEGRRQRLSQALEHLAGARLLWRHLDAASEWANSHLNAGSLYLRMGRLRAARRTLDQACDRFRRLGSAERHRLAICLTWKGRLLGDTGEHEAALKILEEAMELRRAASLAETPGLDALGGLHLAAGRLEQAAELFEKAVAVARNPVDRVNATANLADAHLRLGRLEKAIELSRRSEYLAKEAGLGDPNLSLHNLHVQARGFHGLGQWQAMDGALEWILGTFESLRTQGQGELLLPFFARRRHILDHFVLSWATRGRSREAFEVAESVRSRSLLDHLVWPMNEIRFAADPEQVEELDAARSELGRALGDLERSLLPYGQELGSGAGGTGVPDPGAVDLSLDQTISRAAVLRLRLTAIEAELRRQAGAEGAAVLDLESAQRLLAPETLMLVYWLGDERSLLWSVESDALRLHDELPPKDSLESAITVWRQYLVKGAKAGSHRESKALAEALLGPVADRLWSGRPLVIVVEGDLATVPFSALPKPGKDGEPMVRDHPISYAYSVSTVAAIRSRAEQRSARQNRLISVVADPVYGLDDPRSPRSTPQQAVDGGHERGAGSESLPLSRLAASGIEAQEITRARGSVPRTGLAATKQWVLSGALAESRFVHFGTHARIDPEAPDLSALELTRIDAQGRRIDGSLRLGDLHGLSLSAEVVSLAACDSALGRHLVGEGTMALPRGFLKSGAAAVVAGLWPVADRPTSELMIELYRQLIDLGSAPDQALRAAQLSLLEQGTWSDPVHWAGFVLIGDGSARNTVSSRTFSTRRFLPSARPMERPPLRR